MISESCPRVSELGSFRGLSLVSALRRRTGAQLLELRVLRFCSDEDGNVRVGVFPEREEILIRRL
jgi:hypothetical protein